MALSRRVTAARPAPDFQVAGEAFDVGAADGERGKEWARYQVVNGRRSSA